MNEERNKLAAQAEASFDAVLVGVGGSERSYVALRYAMDLAEAGGGALNATVVRTIPANPVLALSEIPGYREWMLEAERLARLAGLGVERRIEDLSAERGVTVRVEHRDGPVTDRLIEAAGTASCLVMGKRGHRGDHGGLLGGNAELVVRRAHIPVLLTPREYTAPVRVMAAYAAKGAGTAVLSTAVVLSRILHVPLQVLTVERDTNRLQTIQEQARRELDRLGGSASLEHSSGRVADAIVSHTAADTLLVMGAYGHPRVYRMALGSVTEEVVRRTTGPVLLAGKLKPEG